ncbi:MAG: tetratricopeptide repeat protein [Elusimicrobia bacterium]|nr:tetratricopeptide repeat protein [Elusimicrobiota bacterium]
MQPLPRLLASASRPLWARLLIAGFLIGVIGAAALALRDAYNFYGGRFFDETGRYGRAAAALERFLDRDPDDPQACQARLRLGRIYNRHFGRYLEAKRLLEAAARGEEGGPCALEAKAELLNCPDYFPLERGRTWVYGDTASGGRNMRLEVVLRDGAGGKVAQTSSLYAGKKRISVNSKDYAKKDWAVWEVSGGKEHLFLRYPFQAGTSWKSGAGRQALSYRIEADALEVRVKAGAFSGCIKVRETDPRFPQSWKFDYFAPGVGRVKTTVGARGVENPNTELISFKAP